MPSVLDQIEVDLRDLSDCDCNSNSELEEEQAKVVDMSAWNILTDDNELELHMASPY